MKTITTYLLILMTSFHLTSCEDGMPKIEALGRYNTFCITNSGIEGELIVDAFKADGFPHYDVEWLFGETGLSLVADGGVLGYDYMLFGDNNAEGFVQLWRPARNANKPSSKYKAQFIIVDKDPAKTQVITAECDHGYWG